jgi:cytochrome c peroxidase
MQHNRWAHDLGTIAALGLAAALALALLLAPSAAADTSPQRSGTVNFPNPFTTPDPTGSVSTYSTLTSFSRQNAFIASLGTNGRVCATCHVPTEGWTIGPADMRFRFEATNGTEAIFRPVDGANSPLADVSTVAARRAAYSMLLNKAVIRVGLPIPPNAEFTLAAVDDPYHYASARELSLFRRPLPSTNLRFLSAVMWDGRETVKGQSIFQDFTNQASNATIGHAEAKVAPTADQLQQMVEFENSLTTAQMSDNAAGPLTAAGGNGGPMALTSQQFYIGINDTLGADPLGKPFNPVAFTLYSQWADSGHSAAQQSVARGQALFNTKQFAISGVGGLNDKLGVPSLQGTCTTCHNTPNVGNHSVSMPLNIGISDASRRTPDLPLYTLRNKATGATVQTTDPGRALITGKWADIGLFKGPILRGLASRAPYFHNGSASDLDAVVDFYNTRFNIGLSAQEHADLVAFLRAL